MADALAIEVRGLEKRYGDRVAVDGIDLDVPRGAFFGFLGQNGAGKTTTIHCLTGLQRKTAGKVTILGEDLDRDLVGLKSRMGVVPERLNLFDRLTLPELLLYAGRLYGLSEKEARARGTELVEVLDLANAGDTLVAHFSKGMARKAALAVALIHGPPLLFLDEPFEGIDVKSAQVIQGLLAGLVKQGATVFLTSHVMDVVARLCDRVAFIAAGKLKAVGKVKELVEPIRASLPDATTAELLERLFLAHAGEEAAAPRSLAWYRP